LAVPAAGDQALGVDAAVHQCWLAHVLDVAHLLVMFLELLHLGAIVQVLRCHAAAGVRQEYFALPVVHDALDYLVLGQLAQHCGQFAVVRVPQLDARGVDRDEYEEFAVEEDVQGWVFVDQVLVLGFVVVVVDELLEAADDPVVRFGDSETLHVVGAHVECLHARQVARVPDFEGGADVRSDDLVGVFQCLHADQ